MKRRLIIAVALLLAAASGSAPLSSGSAETITGAERLGWDQTAADAGELASFRYAWYVDGVRRDAADVSCTAGASAGLFACTSALPAMSAGSHTLQVVAFVIDAGTILESGRSVAVRVVKR